MKLKIKITALLLSAALGLTIFTGCGKKGWPETSELAGLAMKSGIIPQTEAAVEYPDTSDTVFRMFFDNTNSMRGFVKPTIENLGYELYDVQYVKEGKDYFLRIFIEKENGAISLEDCEKVNNEIEEMLDTQDYIKEQYFLEISSTGIEKIIRKEKHLQENLEQDICVKLYKPINNNKEYVGKLKKFDDEIIYLQVNNEIVELERKNISLIKKYYNWN